QERTPAGRQAVRVQACGQGHAGGGFIREVRGDAIDVLQDDVDLGIAMEIPIVDLAVVDGHAVQPEWEQALDRVYPTGIEMSLVPGLVRSRDEVDLGLEELDFPDQ